MKKTYSITGFVKEGLSVPVVSNCVLDENGLLSFESFDLSKFEKYNPIVKYLINVNGTEIETYTTENIFVYPYLIDGNNVFNIKVIITLTDDDGINSTLVFEQPEFTPANLFEYETLNDGVKIVNYTGESTSINIPQYNQDGQEIIGVQLFYNEKLEYIKSDFVKYFSSNGSTSGFTGCTNLKSIIFKNIESLNFTRIELLNCTNLRTIYINSKEYNLANNAFMYCTKLKELILPGLKTNININYSTEFERQDLINFMENLGTPEETQTLNMGSTNLAKLTEEDKLIATNKNWVLA